MTVPYAARAPLVIRRLVVAETQLISGYTVQVVEWDWGWGCAGCCSASGAEATWARALEVALDHCHSSVAAATAAGERRRR